MQQPHQQARKLKAQARAQGAVAFVGKKLVLGVPIAAPTHGAGRDHMTTASNWRFMFHSRS